MGWFVCNRKWEVLSKPVSSSALPHSACSSSPLSLSVSLFLWPSLALAGLFIPISSSCGSFLPFPYSIYSAPFLLRSPSLVDSDIRLLVLFTPQYSFTLSFPWGPYKEQEKEQASLSSAAISYLLSLAHPCRLSHLPLVQPYDRYSAILRIHAGILPVRRSTARSSFSPCPALANIQSLVRRASLKVPGLAFRSQSYPELRR